MKTMKKLLSIAMVLALVLSLGASALAANITVEEKVDGTSGAEYTAWRLLDLTTTEDKTTNAAGEEIGYAYTVNPDFREVLKTVTGKTEDKDIIEYIQDLKGADIDAFTEEMYAAITEAGIAGTTTSTGKFEGVEQGYYLIVETKIGDVTLDDGSTQSGVRSKIMLDTQGRDDLTVTTKEDKPSVEKKVIDTNDSTANFPKTLGEAVAAAKRGELTWQDSADWDIGDKVPFELKVKVQGDGYEKYEKYKVVLHDQESKGLTIDTSSVIVELPDGTQITSADFAAKGIHVEAVTGCAEGCTFHITIDDTKALDVEAGQTFTIYYMSTLNENAEIGSTGNPNEVKMEFSNDYEGEGTGKTPVDTVVVFTYESDVNKVDPDKKPLEGAGFTLLKKVPEPADGSVAKWDELDHGDTGYFTDENGDIWVVIGSQSGKTTFNFKGVDDGEYVLVETIVPDGYNKADDLYFEIVAEHDEVSADPNLTKFAVKDAEGTEYTTNPNDPALFKVEMTKGTVTTDIMNDSGVELPETGGIGTTIFYVVGAILVAGAVILLVTKKRMNQN